MFRRNTETISAFLEALLDIEEHSAIVHRFFNTFSNVLLNKLTVSDGYVHSHESTSENLPLSLPKKEYDFAMQKLSDAFIGFAPKNSDRSAHYIKRKRDSFPNFIVEFRFQTVNDNKKTISSFSFYESYTDFLHKSLADIGMTRELAHFLQDTWNKQYNILIAGPDMSANSRLLNALSAFPFTQRSASIGNQINSQAFHPQDILSFRLSEGLTKYALLRLLSMTMTQSIYADDLPQDILCFFADVLARGYYASIASVQAADMQLISNTFEQSEHIPPAFLFRLLEDSFDLVFWLDATKENPVLCLSRMTADENGKITLLPIFNEEK